MVIILVSVLSISYRYTDTFTDTQVSLLEAEDDVYVHTEVLVFIIL